MSMAWRSAITGGVGEPAGYLGPLDVARRKIVCRAASSALLGLTLFSAVVCAESRFAFQPTVSSGAMARAVTAPDRESQSFPTTTSAARYAIRGSLLGVPDEIFSDGFESIAAYDVTLSPNISIGNGVVLLGSLNVPAGSYVAIARLQVFTGSEVNPANSYRFDCSLSPGFDSGVFRVGQQSSVERYLTVQGAATLANAGAIQLSCRDGNGHTDTVLSGKLTVISVGGIN